MPKSSILVVGKYLYLTKILAYIIVENKWNVNAFGSKCSGMLSRTRDVETIILQDCRFWGYTSGANKGARILK